MGNMCRVPFSSFESDYSPKLRTSGIGPGLAGHFLYPDELIHLVSLVDVVFYNIKYLYVPK